MDAEGIFLSYRPIYAIDILSIAGYTVHAAIQNHAPLLTVFHYPVKICFGKFLTNHHKSQNVHK